MTSTAQMSKFLIEQTATATEKNKFFKGEVMTSYSGKKGEFINNQNHIKWFAKEYGFSTKAAAASALKREKEHYDRFEQKYGTWTHEYRIIEVFIAE